MTDTTKPDSLESEEFANCVDALISAGIWNIEESTSTQRLKEFLRQHFVPRFDTAGKDWVNFTSVDRDFYMELIEIRKKYVLDPNSITITLSQEEYTYIVTDYGVTQDLLNRIKLAAKAKWLTPGKGGE